MGGIWEKEWEIGRLGIIMGVGLLQLSGRYRTCSRSGLDWDWDRVMAWHGMACYCTVVVGSEEEFF